MYLRAKTQYIMNVVFSTKYAELHFDIDYQK